MSYVTGISGNVISAASAGWAPTNSAEVSAIASAYATGSEQVVTAVGTSDSGITSINNSGLVDTAALHSADYSSLYVQEPLYISSTGDSSYIGISGDIGGVDSATCSAIASAYAESAASGKLDTTAQVVSAVGTATAYTPDGVGNVVTSINGNYISAHSADSAFQASYDEEGRELTSLASEYTVSSIASSYAESAVSGKADSSALSSYALSADVSGTVDLVSTQSANWGGSALALSAGPGVRLEKVGDTLVAGLDETVLWSGSGNAFTTPEPITNFSEIKFHIKSHPSANVGEVVVPMVDNNRTAIKLSWVDDWSKGTDWLGGLQWWVNLNNTGMTSFGIGDAYYMGIRNATTVGCGSYGSNLYVLDVIGVGRTAEA